MRTGKILSLDLSEGIGYIEDENEQDIMFHIDSSYNELKLKDNVHFNIELTNRGLKATNIITFQ